MKGMAQAPPQLGMRARLALVSCRPSHRSSRRGFDALQRNAARAQHLFCHARCTRTRAQPSRSRCRTCLCASRRFVGAARMGIPCDAHRFRKIGPDRPRAGNDRMCSRVRAMGRYARQIGTICAGCSFRSYGQRLERGIPRGGRRLAPQDRIGETTGAVLTASYAGLLATPVLISAIETFAGLAGAFIGLAILAFSGTAALIRGNAR